jgi:hypothetical protein
VNADIVPLRASLPQRPVTKTELARHFGRSTRWVELKVREGMPFLPATKRYPRKRYDVLACERWLGDSERKRLIAAERIAALEAQVASLAVQVEELRRTA